MTKRVIFLVLVLPLMLGAARETLMQRARETNAHYHELRRELVLLETRLSEAGEGMDVLGEDVARQELLLEHYGQRLLELEEDLVKGEESLAGRWGGLYRVANGSPLGGRQGELDGYVRVILVPEVEHLRRTREMRSLVAETRERLALLKSGMEGERDELGESCEGWERRIREGEVILASLGQDARDYQLRLRALLLGAPGGTLLEQRGRLPWPVSGVVARGFGVQREQGIPVVSHGLDIAAGRGQPVSCVCEGTVVFRGWLERWGNTLIVNHGEGYYSVYGCLDRMRKDMGGRVAAREVIGEVGYDSRQERPLLHFEIRHHEVPEDPLTWLGEE